MQKRLNHDEIHPDFRAPGRSLAGFAFLALLLTLPRFAHTTPDSTHYVALAAYFQGELPREALQSPFAFRWVVPWVASWVPGLSHANAIAFCSALALLAATACWGLLLARLVATRRQWQVGMLLIVVSFPTINYGASVLTDGAGFLVLVLASWAMAARRFLLLALVLMVGVGVRESTLLMLPVLWLYLLLERDVRGMGAALAITLAALTAVLVARWWFSDLPAYFWTPTWKRSLANLTRPVSWATVLLTVIPVALAGLGGVGRWRLIPLQTRHFIMAVLFPGLALAVYSVMAAFMSGRFCWPLYLALAPLAAWSVTGPPPSRFRAGSGGKSRSGSPDSAG